MASPDINRIEAIRAAERAKRDRRRRLRLQWGIVSAIILAVLCVVAIAVLVIR